MKTSSGIQVDMQLIGKYLSGEASPEEALAIDNWRGESPHNNRVFESAARLWDGSSEKNVYRQPQNAAEWEKLKKVIGEKRQESVSRMNKSLPVSWKIAAAFLILLGIAVVFYLQRPRTTTAAYGKVIRAERSVIKDTLRDSTVISLASHSRLSLQERFGTAGRETRLNGESYFSVKRSAGRPFIIRVGGIKITVLGTAFNVKEYPEKVTVSVKKGMVRMQKDSAALVVKAGSTGTYYQANRQFVLYADSLNINIFGYATGELDFNNVSMKEVKNVLENTYNIKILFNDSSLSHLRINTHFKNRSLDYVLKVISASLDIQYDLKHDTLYFFKGRPR